MVSDFTVQKDDKLFSIVKANTDKAQKEWNRVIYPTTSGTGKVYSQNIDFVISQFIKSGFTVEHLAD